MSERNEPGTGQGTGGQGTGGQGTGGQGTGGHGTGHDAWVNQPRHEPTPASHHADQGQQAPATSEQHSAARPRGTPEGTAAPGPVVHGDAVRDMMGGPQPQGDVPDAPGTQIAAAEPTDPNQERGGGPGRGQRARCVANAVPGKPDGEVDTRS
jgi:hypothetical protein